MNHEKIILWLLDGDVYIQYQVHADLLGLNRQDLREKIALEDWGKRLLDVQDPEGSWAKGLYAPKWTTTTYTLLFLFRMRLPPDNEQAQRGSRSLFDKGIWFGDAIIFWKRPIVDVCVLGLVLSIAAYFKVDHVHTERILKFLSKHQSDDGSWNVEVHDLANKPFHITLAVLEGLFEYQQVLPKPDSTVNKMIEAGQHFLKSHGLYLHKDSNQPMEAIWTRFSFPPRWHYDVLRALDYFQASGVPNDKRLGPAVELVRRKQQKDGTWKRQAKHPGRVYFEMEKVGMPSRWNTLRALRVLAYFEKEKLPQTQIKHHQDMRS